MMILQSKQINIVLLGGKFPNELTVYKISPVIKFGHNGDYGCIGQMIFCMILYIYSRQKNLL